MNKITLAPIGQPKPPRKRRKMTLTDEQRAAQGERLRLLMADPEIRAKRLAKSREAKARQWADPEFRKKQTERLATESRKIRALNRYRQTRRWQDPAFREKVLPTIAARWQSEEHRKAAAERCKDPNHRRKMIAGRIRAHDRKRGFKVPPSKKAEYTALVQVKKMKPREAGRLLGII